jgi:hypothetical protein
MPEDEIPNTEQADGSTTKSQQIPAPNIPSPPEPGTAVNVVEVDPEPKSSGETNDTKQSANTNQKETLDAIRKGERIALIIAGIVAFATIGQLVITLVNNGNTSDQADKMILVSQRNERAATKFADQARRINIGISDAVAKLNVQAGALKDSSDQTRRLADATESANRNALESDRPWIGALPVVANIEAGQTLSMGFTFTNSGKRPAFVESTKARFDVFLAFPDDPEHAYVNPHNELPSTDFIVPGMNVQAVSRGDEPVSQQVVDLVNSGRAIYYSFGEVIYRDTVTNEEHITQVCVRFYPQRKNSTDFGWRNCQQYNYAN